MLTLGTYLLTLGTVLSSTAPFDSFKPRDSALIGDRRYCKLLAAVQDV